MSTASIDRVRFPIPQTEHSRREDPVRGLEQHRWSLIPPEEAQIHSPWTVGIVTFFVIVGTILANLTLIPLAIRTYSWIKLRPLHNAIEEQFADTLETALDIELQGRSSSKTISDWLQDRAFFSDTRSAYLNTQRRTGRVDQEVQNRVARESDQFCRMVRDVHKMVENRDHYASIREKMHEVMKTPVYQALKSEAVPSVEFLQVLAVKLHSVDCRDAIREYGEQCITPFMGTPPAGDLADDLFSWSKMAEIMDDEVDGWSFKRNTWYQKGLWGATHPLSAIRSVGSEYTPTEYNPHPENPNLYAHDFVLGDKQIRFCYGPGPTGDLIYEAGVLEYMDKLQARGVNTSELRINLQSHRSNHKLGKTAPEHLRVCEMLRFQESHPESLKMMSLAFDTEAREMGDDFIDPEGDQFDMDDVFGKLAEHYLNPDQVYRFGGDLIPGDPVEEPDLSAFQQVRHDGTDNGWYIPERVLEHSAVTQAFSSSKALFDDLGVPEMTPKAEDAKAHLKDKKAFGAVMLLTIEGMVSLGALHQAFENAPTADETAHTLAQFNQKLDADLAASRTFGHCKQDIDRAIVNNIVLRLLHRTYTDVSPITRDELNEIVGGVLGRARIVNGRTIQTKRYDNLSDFLGYFGTQERVRVLQRHLQSYIRECSLRADIPEL